MRLVKSLNTHTHTHTHKRDLPLISVIVPVYNVEAYLRQCLDSIINQTYKNIEIVCVNDVSPDNSLAILNEYAAKDSRIIVVNKEINEGVALARKTGLENSNGRYVIMIDSDDTIEPNMLEVMLGTAISQDLDMVCCGLFAGTRNGEIVPMKAPGFAQSKIERIILASFGGSAAATAVWNKLVKREIYEKISYPPRGLGDDDFMLGQVVYYCDKIADVEECFYHWRYVENSACRNKKNPQKEYDGRIANYWRIIEFCKEKFGDDLSIFEPNLTRKRLYIENINPNRNIILQELYVLRKFLKKSPLKAIKEAQSYIVGRASLNIEKVQNTDEAYLVPVFMELLKAVKKM
ncbi:MAG: glycosyltransferase [Chitinivibrionia bacterium]|nr:glycosyltransferase [Chitinivibrionia bacterium]